MNPYAPPSLPDSPQAPPNSIKLGRFFGISVFVEAHILIPLLIIVLSSSGAIGLGIGLAFFLIIFTSVLLHEFGHALAAKKCWIRTQWITLGMLGGVAHLTGAPRNVRQDLFITIAGPAVNVVLALASYGSLWALTGSFKPGMEATLVHLGLYLIGMINLNLLWFNLIPAWPLDGGRILRALLSLKFGARRAMIYTCRTALVAAIGLGIWAIWRLAHGSPAILLAFIAYSIFITAKSQLQAMLVPLWPKTSNY